jgi:hypothetical protein
MLLPTLLLEAADDAEAGRVYAQVKVTQPKNDFQGQIFRQLPPRPRRVVVDPKLEVCAPSRALPLLGTGA